MEIFDVPAPRILQKGQRFFDLIYGKISKRVMGQMDRSGTEDLGISARLMYGYILSNTSVLSAAETSFVLLAALIPQDVSPRIDSNHDNFLITSVAEVGADFHFRSTHSLKVISKAHSIMEHQWKK